LDRAVVRGLPTGFALLDAELPGGGLPASGLMEILHDEAGIGEVSLLLGALRQIAGEGKAIAWINPPHLPYAPALACAGVPLEACLVVRPATAEDVLWSVDQALRSGACGAALFWLREKTDYASLRRLQMAAESGHCLAVLFRPTACGSPASPAHLRVLLSHRDGRLLVSLPKRRGPPLYRPVEIRLPGRPEPKRRGAPHGPAETLPLAPGVRVLPRHATLASA
jgi:cell division inhibitor SulA/protein ImuA